MIYCLNSNCPQPKNPDTAKDFCESCGSKLLINNVFLPIELLGQGCFGRSFRAVNYDTIESHCVIKELSLPPQLQQNPALLESSIELFNQKAPQLYELGKQTEIPSLISHFHRDGYLYLVQEFIEGQNLLSEMQQQGVFSEAKIRELMMDLLPVLNSSHSQQVIHRNIKPENIIRRQVDGKFVLSDFGGAIPQIYLARVCTGIYSLGYAPIEQMAGRVCNASDLYAFGATCVRMMTGCLPVQNKDGDMEDNVYDAMNDRWLWRERLREKGGTSSNELGQILDKLLQHLPKDRYQDAEEVIKKLNPPPQPKPQVSTTTIPATTISPAPRLQQFEFNCAIVDARGREIKRQPRTVQYLEENLGNDISLEMVLIPEGTFLIDLPDTEKKVGHSDKSSQRKVTVKSFFIGKSQVTQAQWKAVALLPQIKQPLSPDPSRFKGANRPGENISWYDAVEFCARLSRKTGRAYRLPSEAQWEYTYRSDTITSELATERGNYTYGSEQTLLQAVNPFGLDDKYEQIWEWCADPWCDNYLGATIQGRVWDFGGDDTYRLLRRGSRHTYIKSHTANRFKSLPKIKIVHFGFRVVAVS